MLGGAGVALFLATAFTPLPNLLSRWMSLARSAEGAAAIVVLGGGGVRPDGALTDTSLRRTIHGIRLYRQGLAPLLLFSGSPPGPGGAEAEARAALARACAIAPAAILTVSAGRTTREEARHIAGLLRLSGARKILLVADAQGMGRATRLFAKAGFEVLPSPADDVSGFAGGPEDRLDLMRRAAMELVAWLYYRLAGHL
jgi:uncharacterized SAM-binding protein YcdF (DUF218 family)